MKRPSQQPFLQRGGRHARCDEPDERRKCGECKTRKLPPAVCQMLVKKLFPELEARKRWAKINNDPRTRVAPGMPTESIH